MICLKTERLTIRPIAEDDWRSIQSIWADFNKSPMHFYDTPHDTEDEQVKRRVQKWMAFSGGLEHMFFAVCLGDTVIGCVSFNIRIDGHEIGYCFHSDYHGKGYAKESMLALFDYVKSLGINRLTAGTAIQNLPSVSLLKALGFKLTEMEKVSFYKDEDGNDIFFDGGVFEINLTR